MTTKYSSAVMTPPLTPIIDNKPAPKVLLIRIDVGTNEATFHCKKEETPENKIVVFLANKDCELYFTNHSVFGKPFHSLQEGVPWIATMADKAQPKEKTGLYVKMVAGEPDDFRGDPIVIVP